MCSRIGAGRLQAGRGLGYAVKQLAQFDARSRLEDGFECFAWKLSAPGT
jgi:hypothetical protein